MTQWRKATWALAIWNVLMMLWLATAIGGVGPFSCAGETGAALAVCRAGVDIGVTYGVTFWLIGFIAFGLVWLMSRPKSYGQ
jgi:hypothetical protein